MGLQVKVIAATSEEVFVTGLGSFVPGEWTEITEAQALRFEALHGVTLEDASNIEVKKKTSTKKEDE